MGLNKVKMQPCGFCFVEYATRKEAAVAVDCLNRSTLDGRMIRVDWDYGFEPQRQFGRGKTGGQVRDEMRANAGAQKDEDRPLNSYKKYDNNREHRGGRAPYHSGGGGGHYDRTDSNYNRKRNYRDRYDTE